MCQQVSGAKGRRDHFPRLVLRAWVTVLRTGLVLALTLGIGALDSDRPPEWRFSASAGLCSVNVFKKSGTVGLGFDMFPSYPLGQ